MDSSFFQRNISLHTKLTMGLVLAGGRGTRLNDLTRWRVKPAVPFGGKFRIIDFTLSNCINSGVRHIGILTQYKSQSLIRHIMKGWATFHTDFGGFIEFLPAQQRIEEKWYSGTADAIYQNIDLLRRYNPENILILAGDHVYKMDYGPMIAFHIARDADVTISCIEIPREAAANFGIMSVDEDLNITDFQEKPSNPKPLPGKGDRVLASMGIYVFKPSFLFDQLIKDSDNHTSTHDFGRDIIPSVINKHSVVAYPYKGIDSGVYWRDVGTVDSYWKANMELIGVTPELNLYDQEWPIRTTLKQYPPVKFLFDDDGRRGMAVDSMISEGSIISGAKVSNSLLFTNVRVESYSTIENSVILPNVNIGRNCHISNAVIDKECSITDGTVIGEKPDRDWELFYVSNDGITLVTPNMLGQIIHRVR